MSGTRKLSVRLDTGSWETLEQVCAKTGRNVTGVVRLALDMFFDLKDGTNVDISSFKAIVPSETAAAKLANSGVPRVEPPAQTQEERAVAPMRTGMAPARRQERESVSRSAKADGSAMAEATIVGNEETVLDIPEAVTVFVRSVGAFGAASWVERRKRFLSAIALAQVCWKISGEQCDAKILADFLALGKKHRMF